MLDRIYYFITVPMVYLAFAWCLVGVAVRVAKIMKTPKHPFTLKIFPDKDHPVPSAVWGALSMPTARRHNPTFWFFLILFHLGFGLLILGHLDMLPQINLYPADSVHMIGNGFVGVAVTVSVLYFLFRRFGAPIREFSVPADFLLLFLLFIVFMTGDIISWANSWNPDGFVLTKADFGSYLSSLAHFTWADPSETLQGSHYVVMVVHVLLANLFLMILPFSKVMHAFFAMPLNAIRRG
ncbi:MAG: respiratory nitrate reductase subunit gamma [Deltaproteobacteria bacterium]|nr:respiratory nitrate reductase subunit gamma [Deltaproteobacteria bacterium]